MPKTNRVEIQSNDLGILLTPKRYNRGGRYVGTAILSDATVKDGIITGNLLGEYLEVYPLSQCEIPGPVKEQMKILDESVTQAKVVYATKEEILYLS